MFMTLEIELDGPVSTIWMNRPELHNAFDENLILELTAACVALDRDKDVRVVVLAGRGRSFSAGADLNWMKRAADNGIAENQNDARALANMLRTLAMMKKPTIARVQGAAHHAPSRPRPVRAGRTDDPVALRQEVARASMDTAIP